ncbi:MAG: methionine ABC transporter ATP-binding protein [Treponema sp.]|nr:methionine ABC transporter ATP-binding protein [Treponema sp.]
MQIKLNDLKKSYSTKDGVVNAVDGVSLEIPDNTIFGIIGKSGAGKSTLVRLISLLEKPDSGSIFYGNKQVDSLGKNELIAQRRRIGMIFQNFNLFSSRTAAKNIAYPLEICNTPKDKIESRVKEMLNLVGLADRADAPVSTLSGGQKQRIAIARALATEPDILFCDEATSALDPQTTQSILDLIRQIQAKMNLTVVMITHQMEVVRDACSLVAVVDDGRVVEQGTVSDVFTCPKSFVTKDFISRITQAQPQILRWSEDGGKYILHFVGSDTDRPVLSDLCKKVDVDLNIRAGGIQTLPGKKIGTMITDITGSKENVQKALAYLKERGIIVEDAEEGK